MSIRMKLANWLSGGRLRALELHRVEVDNYSDKLLEHIEKLKVDLGRMRIERATMPVSLSHKDSEISKLRDALKRIYDTPCGPKSNGTQRKIRRIAAHALWKE